MAFKFERLEVWQMSLDYVDLIYKVAEQLPKNEDFNLKSQITRAAVSVSLNIAEGSTGQTDAEQARFLGLAIRSLIETVACQHLINRRNYLTDKAQLRELSTKADALLVKLTAMRKAIEPTQAWLREERETYNVAGNAWTEVAEVAPPSSVIRPPSE